MVEPMGVHVGDRTVPIGLIPPYRANVASDPGWMTAFAQQAEALGFESLYLVEHVVVPTGHAARYPYSGDGRMPLADDCELPDPLELAAFLLARTERLILATGILVGPHHHPLVLAKRVATLDVLSGGRFRLGLGVGWMREELEATGIDPATRGRRLDELIDAMHVVWRDDEPTHHGEFFRFDSARSHPKPIRGTVDIHIGGHSRSAAVRAGRRAEGLQPLGLAGADLAERLAEMQEAAAIAGRDAAGLEVTLGAPLATIDDETVATLVCSGATRVLCSARSVDPADVSSELAGAAARLGLTGAQSSAS
jgi:probable F420-dependent oxidoreductase